MAQTRTYTANRAGCLLVDDLLAVTSLKTDVDGDGTYETTWATSDYHLLPLNAAYQSPPGPAWEIATTPNGDYAFPVGVARGVEIVGTWGHYDQRATSSATASAIASSATTSVTVSDGTQLEVGQTIKIDSEQLFIRAISVNVLTVTRGVNGTTAATHSAGAAIWVYQYPVIADACRQQALMDFRAKDAPLGVAGAADFGGPVRTVSVGGLHPFVKRMLDPFRRHVTA